MDTIESLLTFLSCLGGVIAQSQNETNETDIGENQSVSDRISGFGGDFGFGPRVVDDPAMVYSS